MIASPSEAFLEELADAERTIWEFFLIAHAASQHAKKPKTAFTASMVETALAGAQREADDKNPRARSTQFELYVAALLAFAGIDAELDEPDLRVRYRDGYAGIAIKRMGSLSLDKLETRLLDGAEQIDRWVTEGFIAVNLDIIFRGRGLPTDDADRAAEFKRMTDHVAAVINERFGPLKKVRGILIFGHLETWDLTATPPRHDNAYAFSRHLFDEEEDRSIARQAADFWDPAMEQMDRELTFLQTGQRPS